LAITASPSTAPVRHLAVLEHTGDPVRPDAIARLVEQFDGDEGLGALEDEIAEDASKRQGRKADPIAKRLEREAPGVAASILEGFSQAKAIAQAIISSALGGDRAAGCR
jgi:hypothetical protein